MNLTPAQTELVKKNAALPFILDKLNEIEQKIEKDPPEDVRLEKAVTKAIAKFAVLDKGEKGDKGDRGEKGDKGEKGKDGADSTVRGPKGEKGEDGKTPTNAEIERLIEPLIPAAEVVDKVQIQRAIEDEIVKNLPQFGTAFRDGLELLDGDERLDITAIAGVEELQQGIKDAIAKGGGRIGWGAHPLTIQQSGTTKAKVARVINFTGATVTLSATGVITVAITGGSGGGLTIETPTGTVNGTNATFTVSATPQYIVVDGITYFENNGYTLSGLTITTSVPPTGFIRSFY